MVDGLRKRRRAGECVCDARGFNNKKREERKDPEVGRHIRGKEA